MKSTLTLHGIVRLGSFGSARLILLVCVGSFGSACLVGLVWLGSFDFARLVHSDRLVGLVCLG